MTWWRRKKPAVEIIAPAGGLPAAGFFSTNADFRTEGAMDIAARAAAAINRSIQKPYNKFVALSRETGVAMDSALQPGITNAKFINSGFAYLPIQQLEWYASQGFIGWQNCAIISQNWLVDKALGMPAKDAVRHGWSVEFNGSEEVSPDVVDAFAACDRRYGIKKNCIEFIKLGRTFGIRHALFLIEGMDYEAPFNPDGIRLGSYKGITQIDPYWIAPELSAAAAGNPSSPDFYEPTWWRVNGRRVHRSHFIIMRNGDQVPDILKPTYFYGGIPTTQKIFERVYAAERTANEAPLLAMSKRLTVLNVDMTQVMADVDKFNAKMDRWVALRDNTGVKIVGQGETISQFDTSLAELDATIMTQYQLVAAAAEVPATKLLGTTPKGFNATGEYDERSYHESLESIQENDLTALVDRHNVCVMRSEIAPRYFGGRPLPMTVKWNPVNAMTAEELAEVNVKKSQSDKNWSDTGAIDAVDIRGKLIKDPDSGYSGISDIVPEGPTDDDTDPNDDGGEVNEGDSALTVLVGDYDAAKGKLEGARIITHQRFLNEKIVAVKMLNRDFTVNVTPEFEDEGKKYRMVIDGHHSLAAAVRLGERPNFVEKIPRDVVFNPITGQATDGAPHKT